jgi:hypothetical protein
VKRCALVGGLAAQQNDETLDRRNMPHAPERFLNPPRKNTSSALRWFAAEFFVVVTGVTVALGATSWWEATQSREREAAYLGQLLADLDQTKAMVTRADEDMHRGDEAAVALVGSFQEATPPSLDSIYLWVDAAFQWSDSPRMVVATAQALMATGDLTLIRSDSLRVAIVSYLEVARGHEVRNQSDFEFYRRAIQQVLEGVDRGQAFPTSVVSFLDNRRVYNGAQTLSVMRYNEAGRRRQIKRQAEVLRRLAEDYLAERR